MKGNLFLKLEWKRNSKNKSKILSITFLDTFCICSRKNGGGGDGASALIHPVLHTFDTAYAEN